jgi:hypothetical protein
VSAHLLLAKAYPIQEFERPLNFMLDNTQKELPEYKGILSESRKNSWIKFKETDKYQEWRIKRSIHCREEMINNKASTMSNIRHSKEGSSEEISKQFKELWSDPIYKKQLIESMVKERNTPEGKSRMKLAAQNTWDNKTEEERIAFNKTMNGVNNNKEKRLKNSKTTKEKWENDPEFVAKMKQRKPKPKGGGSDAMKAKWADPVWRKSMLDKRAESRRIKNETIKG